MDRIQGKKLIKKIAIKKSKHKNKPITIDGIKFRSTGEGLRYRELKLLERAGRIRDLKLQVAFRFQSGIKYVADFTYYDIQDLKHVVEDFKGQLLPVYRLKKTLFIWEFVKTGKIDKFVESYRDGTIKNFIYKEKNKQ